MAGNVHTDPREGLHGMALYHMLHWDTSKHTHTCKVCMVLFPLMRLYEIIFIVKFEENLKSDQYSFRVVCPTVFSENTLSYQSVMTLTYV